MSTPMRSPFFCAIDTTDLDRAGMLADVAREAGGGIKIGKEFFTRHGPGGVKKLRGGDETPLFLDLKFHDIPNTVAGAARSALDMGPAILNVHAAGGRAMMRAAREAVDGAGGERPKLIAVTILTSLDEADLVEIGLAGPVEVRAIALARLARDCGLDGVVCSPREIGPLRRALGPHFLLVVPGVRPAGMAPGDQKRVTTPAEALGQGADYLVVGRPISAAADPAEAARAIAAELAEARP